MVPRRDGTPVDVLTETLRDAQRLGMLGPRPIGDVIEHAEQFVRALDGVTGTIVDLGSGGGVPGLVIAVGRPDLAVVLVDRREKRTDFLERAVARLAMGDRVTPVRPLPRVIAIANQKGGVGKTTTTINLGACLAEMGLRTLVIDLDPQGNASTGLGIENRGLETSMYDVLMHDVPLETASNPPT
jgi:Flp pilus assembly CpaE family ATPase